MNTAPSRDEFIELAHDRRVIPVFRTLLADGETAVGLYRKLAGERAGTFLLESAEHGHSWSRYSFIGVRSSAMLSEVDGRVHWSGTVPEGIENNSDPIAALRSMLDVLDTPNVNVGLTNLALPPLTGGVVGYLGYDIVRRFERLPEVAPETLHLPELAMLLATDLAVLDHVNGSVTLIANAINYDNSGARVEEAWADAVSRLDDMQRALSLPVSSTAATYENDVPLNVTRETATEDYVSAVEVAKERIRAGDAFQIVLSQRFSTECSASALDVYRILRASNPSPYMFLIRVPEVSAPGSPISQQVAFDLVGSSPEALVKLPDGLAMVHPIAGTRRRGQTPEEDIALAQELMADKKELAEHLMLVDLGRNDLGRVSIPGSVEVVDFMSVDRYRHVMHIV